MPTDNWKLILGCYTTNRDYINPITGRPLSKAKRIDALYAFVNKPIYGIKITDEEKLMAWELVKKILQEEVEPK